MRSLLIASLLLSFSILSGANEPGDPLRPSLYPSYENGTSVPLAERPLQALNVGSTFKRPRLAGSVNFIDGIYTEEGPIVPGQEIQGKPHCLVDSNAPGTLIDSENIESEFQCRLSKIEGAEYIEKGAKTSSYRTSMDLVCGSWNTVSISCYSPSDGNGREMRIGEFEKIFAKHFLLGSLQLETPLIGPSGAGFPIEDPIVPSEIIEGRLVFNLLDETPLTYTKEEDDEVGRFQRYFQNGESFDSHPQNLEGKLLVVVNSETPSDLKVSAKDLDSMAIKSTGIGYSKHDMGKGTQLRSATLLVRGEIEVSEQKHEAVVYWHDPLHSHITYEGMWKIPGRDFIENTVVLK